MKGLIIILLFGSKLCIASSIDTLSQKDIGKLKNEQRLERKIDDLNSKLQANEERLLNGIINSYQLTNDRINNQMAFISLISTIFGLILAVAGIFLAFESIKSQKRKEEAIQTLEVAKQYVEDKKFGFDETINAKSKELNDEYQLIIKLSKERLIEDINSETQRLKDLAEKKSEEIEAYSLEEKTEKKFELLQKRIEFFENIGIPEDPQLLLSKAKILSGKEMHEEAIELLNKLITIQPKNDDAYWQLGQENYKLLRYQESINFYKKCLEIQPNTASTHNNIGVDYEAMKKSYDALQSFNKAIELKPKKVLYYNNKARVLKVMNSKEEALKAYREALNLDPKQSAIYYSIINLLEGQGLYEKAIEFYDLAIENLASDGLEFKVLKEEALKKIN